MKNKPNNMTALEKWMAPLWCICFAALAWYYLITKNSDTLYMAQSRSLYYDGAVFFKDCMQLPGGLLAYAGSWLTQFFYHPMLGGGILIVLWLLLAVGIKFASRIKGILMPLALIVPAMLLIGVIDLGYWLYYLKFPGYYFVPTLGLLMVVGWQLIRFPHKGIASLALAATYPLFGAYSLIAMLLTAIGFITFPKEGKDTSAEQRTEGGIWKWINAGLPLVMIILTPVLWYRAYSEMSLSNGWIAGVPTFAAESTDNWMLSLPFVVAILWIVVMALPFRLQINKKMEVVCSIVVAGLLGFMTCYTNFDNYNYHAEMRMYKAAEDYNWDEVLTEMSKLPGDATRQMVILKNIALFNKGTAGSQFFHYNNMGEPPYVFDSLRVHMVQTGAPLLYMHHGKTNFSIRWCVENSVEYNFSYNNLRIMSVCALLNGEYKLARKYLDILSNTLFQKEWAEHYLPATEKSWMMSAKNIKKYYPELANIKELRDNMGSVLDGDNGIPEMYLINYFSHTMNKDSKYFQEMTLDYALVQKDIQLFWPRFVQYAILNKDVNMPIHYQEAAYLYGKLEPQSMDISHMPFDQHQILERYERFNQTAQSLLNSGMTNEQVGEAIKATYGDTFWWFYFFCRDISSY